MKTIVKILSLFLLVGAMQTTATAQDKPQKGLTTQISYYVPYVAAQPIRGTSDHLRGEIDYDDTTGVINELNFEVFLNTFIDDFNVGATSYIAWLGNVYRFPEMSFSSNSIKEDGDELQISGTLYFRGEYRATTIHAKRSEDDELIQLRGNFTIYPRDYASLISPYYRAPSRVEFQLNMNFPKGLEG